MKKDVKYNEHTKELFEQLPKGAFLTVKHEDKIDTMTIGWGTVGYIWQKPIFTVAVRYSRYTHEIISKSQEFTVSIPVNKDLKQALATCGTKSGRDIDKFKECGLTAEAGKVITTPVIGECDLHYECKIVYKQDMEPAQASDDIHKTCYPKGDFHVLYYGQIVACYVKE
ncbi:flavin reductase domain protein FMN-binding [Desulfofarcimen acetoxidans DSM 771]|uniref:Flavin reductase domain protein FMN-binding n=1 Tax=Desulfofarcimen acetoxidans (strain ATCC 49208 / DSM 771 / KCTC 5769 / VKM B-1644 / 5575) TaxID=485916 RepID=C8VY15_DESAS|nr:flavin reductase family protein [Desulfofarcimen acetoxidans]ACV64644.1 flavin reductase domain protein FMN-binding [Desulfofarcimen acetoxidans DSM 771]